MYNSCVSRKGTPIAKVTTSASIIVNCVSSPKPIKILYLHFVSCILSLLRVVGKNIPTIAG